MRLNGLRAQPGFRIRGWVAGKPSVLVPNVLQRQFTVTRRNKAWAHRYHVHSDVAGLALPGRRSRFVLSQGGRLVGGAENQP